MFLCWCERDQGYADDDEDRHTHQFSARNHIPHCLRAHNGAMSEARPCCKSDQAATRRAGAREMFTMRLR